jgi:hypothetical protein
MPCYFSFPFKFKYMWTALITSCILVVICRCYKRMQVTCGMLWESPHVNFGVIVRFYPLNVVMAIRKVDWGLLIVRFYTLNVIKPIEPIWSLSSLEIDPAGPINLSGVQRYGNERKIETIIRICVIERKELSLSISFHDKSKGSFLHLQTIKYTIYIYAYSYLSYYPSNLLTNSNYFFFLVQLILPTLHPFIIVTDMWFKKMLSVF